MENALALFGGDPGASNLHTIAIGVAAEGQALNCDSLQRQQVDQAER